ncbi:unnamed protein product, partial [Amoebophrya sp. A120]
VWQSEKQFNLISKYIREGHKVCEKWNENLLDWTGTDWKAPGLLHQWNGEPMRDTFMQNLAARVHQVAEIRTQHDQILKLCPPDQQGGQVFSGNNVFDSFQKVSTFMCNDYTLPLWNAAVEDYEKKMAPLEGIVAESNALHNTTKQSTNTNPTQSVRVFQRYGSILERTNVRNALTNEREKVLAEISDFLERIKSEFDLEDMAQDVPLGRNFSLYLRKVLWLEQLRTKSETVLRPMLSGFLKDLPQTSRVAQNCKKLRQELKDAKQRCFKDWEEEMDHALSQQNNYSLQLQGKVMEFDTSKQGALKITYPEQLVHLIKEVRLFEQMGFNVSKSVKKQVDLGLKFYRFAVQLKQICNFHNHLGAEILACQKLLVLNAAVRFEKLFSDSSTSSSGISKMQWDSVDKLEDFTIRVKDGAGKLRSLNRKLRLAHNSICELVLSLANVSLLKQREQWKLKLQEISKVITNTKPSKNPDTFALDTWRAFWDYQLFKILECQYRLGLESLNESLPEMKADLVFGDNKIKLKPPLEELKTNYYKEIKQFVQLPQMFKGLEGAGHIFASVTTRNPDSLLTVFQKGENLFSKVNDKISDASGDPSTTSAKGGKDPSKLLVEKFDDTKEFDLNFKFIKQKKKEVEKIPDVIKIDCLKLSTVLLKSTIEDQLDKFSDLLIITLKKQVNTKIKEKMDFFEQSLEKLNVRPDSVSELGQAQAEAAKLIEKQEEVKRELNDLEDKARLLKSVYSQAFNQSGAEGEKMVLLHEKYDEFELRLQTFETLAAELREELLSKMTDRVANMNLEIEKFESKWQALKPKLSTSTAKTITLVEARENAEQMEKSWLIEWEDMKTELDQLLSDCRDFGLPKPDLIDYEPLEKDLTKQQASWNITTHEKPHDKFQNPPDPDTFAIHMWIEFRPRLFKFPDLCIAWETKLREIMAQPKLIPIDNAVIAILAEQISKLRQAHSVLKSMTGEAFEKEHWRLLFQMLHLDSTISINNVQVFHFIQKLELMLQNEAKIKELAARALGEVTIREALMEITSWLELTVFEFTFHTTNDGSNFQVPLVKEWKDLLSAVSDKQALCNSLKDSRYFASFKDQTESYSEKLALLDQTLLLMNKVQRKYVYLEPIFARGALPKERERFERVNRDYKQMMKNFHQAKKVQYICQIRGIAEQFISLQDQLDRCQKALNTYLEEKRQFFPRLYFLGDEDLLEILGQSSNPAVIQTHLKKLFMGIHSVEFEPKTKRILCMKSSLNEVVELVNPIAVLQDGNNSFDDDGRKNDPRPVEQWLSELAAQMVKTLSTNLNKCLQNGNDLNLGKFPSQILNLSGEILFTNQCENAIQTRQIPQLQQKLMQDLQQLTSLKAQKAKDVLQQAKLKALILDVIHQRTVLDDIVNCHSLHDWPWYRQLKYYNLSTKTEARMLEAKQNYTFEYQGNFPKL